MMNPVIIIGGGPAGIASASILAQGGVKTLLIERSKRLGGRAASFFYSRMQEDVDYGEHVLMRCCTESIALLKLLKQENSVSFQPRLRVPMVDERRRETIESSPLPGILHLLPSLLSYRFLPFRTRMRAMRAGLSLLLWDPEDVSFAEWLTDHGQGKAIASLWDPVCIATLNAHTSDVSARMAQVVFKRGFFRPHGADVGMFSRPLSKIFESAIPFLGARQGRVLLGAAARRIIVDDGSVRAVEMADGKLIKADVVISAVSLPDLLQLLPHARRDPFFEPLSEISFSPIVNIHLWFDRPVMDEPFIIGVDSPLQAVFDVSAAHGDTEKHHIVISQSSATPWVDMPIGSIVEEFLSALRKLLPRAREAKLIDSLVIKSRQATFIPSPGADALRPASTTPIKGMFLAGDYTATGWPATIEGAVRSGINAADAMLADH
jgi:squalene-associated FAD-dependent desaturase